MRRQFPEASTFLGLFISLPFFFLLYPASIAYEFLTGQNWPSTLALVAVVVSTALIFLTMWLSSIARIAYLLALTATLNYLVFVGTVSGLGILFAVLSCAGITVVAATIILLTFGLRE